MPNDNRNTAPSAPPASFKEQFETDWIKTRIERETVNFAEKFGKHLVDNRLTTNQIRNFYGEVKRLEGKIRLLAARSTKQRSVSETPTDASEKFLNDDEFVRDFLLLKPKIAYAAQRADSIGIRDFKEVMSKALDAVDFDKTKGVSQRHFDNFSDIFEAIIAYHKAAGGR